MWKNGKEAQVYWAGKGYSKPYQVPMPLWRKSIVWLLWTIGALLCKMSGEKG